MPAFSEFHLFLQVFVTADQYKKSASFQSELANPITLLEHDLKTRQVIVNSCVYLEESKLPRYIVSRIKLAHISDTSSEL